MDRYEKDDYDPRIEELKEEIDRLEDEKRDKEDRIVELEGIIHDAMSKLEEA